LSIFWSNGLVATLMVVGLLLAFGPALSALASKLVRPKASSVAA
jgi:hypothetical protein